MYLLPAAGLGTASVLPEERHQQVIGWSAALLINGNC
jgi:hypothetical protein